MIRIRTVSALRRGPAGKKRAVGTATCRAPDGNPVVDPMPPGRTGLRVTGYGLQRTFGSFWKRRRSPILPARVNLPAPCNLSPVTRNLGPPTSHRVITTVLYHTMFRHEANNHPGAPGSQPGGYSDRLPGEVYRKGCVMREYCRASARYCATGQFV